MKNINLTALDFDEILESLTDYMKTKPEFSDYEFKGSALAVLMDLLAYNTNQNAFLANMLMNEAFLDSAVKRSSVVSRAKQLGYTPRSMLGSIAHVKIEVVNPVNTPQFLTLPKNTQFLTKIEGNTLTFNNPSPVTIEPINGRYIFEDVLLKEGTARDFTFVSATPGTDEKFEIPFDNIDLSTLTVWVQESINTRDRTLYTHAEDIIGVTDQSRVYFIDETSNGRYVIYFGDGIIGKKLSRGNVIRLEFFTVSGSATNVSAKIDQNFRISGSVGQSNDITVTTLSNSTGGGEKEGVASIRYNAPKFYSSKNRVITERDYATIIKSSYPHVESIAVWGGENNDPPVYGKIFIGLKPYKDAFIDDITKEDIASIVLKSRQMMTVIPEFIDPDYIYVSARIILDYNKNATAVSPDTLSAMAHHATIGYFSEELRQFGEKFQHSRLIDRLTDIHPSINNVILDIGIQKRLDPILDSFNSWTDKDVIRFGNSITPGSLTSTRFYTVWNAELKLVYFQDNSNGIINLLDDSSGSVLTGTGTIDYNTGRVALTNVFLKSYPQDQYDIRLNAKPLRDRLNIMGSRDQIIDIDDSMDNYYSKNKTGVIVDVTTS